MKKLVLLIGLVAFIIYSVAPAFASEGFTKIVVKQDPPKNDKADKKDAKCDPAKCDPKKCDPAKCNHHKEGKDAKCSHKVNDAKANCHAKCPHSGKTNCTGTKSEPADEKVPVPGK